MIVLPHDIGTVQQHNRLRILIGFADLACLMAGWYLICRSAIYHFHGDGENIAKVAASVMKDKCPPVIGKLVSCKRWFRNHSPPKVAIPWGSGFSRQQQI